MFRDLIYKLCGIKKEILNTNLVNVSKESNNETEVDFDIIISIENIFLKF